MFKQGSFEKEIFESMKKGLKEKASEQSSEIKKRNLKIAQSLEALKTILKENNFINQSDVVSKYIEKKASKVEVAKSFNNEFRKKVSEKVNNELKYLFSRAEFNEDLINGMLVNKFENKYENLFTTSKTRSINSFSGNQPQDMFDKNVFKDNQVLAKLSKLIDPLEKEINNETVLDANMSDDNTFED